MLPPPISFPFRIKSCWKDFTFNGSLSSISISCSLGAVNIWCEGAIFFPAPWKKSCLVCFVNKGKSRIQQKPNSFKFDLFFLISGLSEPYSFIACPYFKRGKGVLIIFFSGNISFIKFTHNSSVKFRISSWEVKAISISNWVNSGCRSALESSSLKHLAIWKYFSIPATIKSCLYCWGLWGRA